MLLVPRHFALRGSTPRDLIILVMAGTARTNNGNPAAPITITESARQVCAHLVSSCATKLAVALPSSKRTSQHRGTKPSPLNPKRPRRRTEILSSVRAVYKHKLGEVATDTQTTRPFRRFLFHGDVTTRIARYPRSVSRH